MGLRQNVAVFQSGALCQMASDGTGALEEQEVVFCPSPTTKMDSFKLKETQKFAIQIYKIEYESFWSQFSKVQKMTVFNEISGVQSQLGVAKNIFCHS